MPATVAASYPSSENSSRAASINALRDDAARTLLTPSEERLDAEQPGRLRTGRHQHAVRRPDVNQPVAVTAIGDMALVLEQDPFGVDQLTDPERVVEAPPRAGDADGPADRDRHHVGQEPELGRGGARLTGDASPRQHVARVVGAAVDELGLTEFAHPVVADLAV